MVFNLKRKGATLKKKKKPNKASSRGRGVIAPSPINPAKPVGLDLIGPN